MQTSLFLHCAVIQVFNIINALELGSYESNVNLETVIQKLETNVIGETNETFERWHFNKRDQQLHENIGNSVTCNLCDGRRESMIHDRIILGIRLDDYQQTTQDLLKIRQLVCMVSERGPAANQNATSSAQSEKLSMLS